MNKKMEDTRVTIVNPIKEFDSYQTWLAVGTQSFDYHGGKINISDLIIAKKLRDLGCEITYLDAENSDMTHEEVSEAIVNSNPNYIIAGTEPFHHFRYPYPSLDNIINEITPEVIQETDSEVILYGSHLTITKPPVYFHFGCAGEGETTVVAMIKAMSEGHTVNHFQNGKIEPDVNKFPMPAYDLIEDPTKFESAPVIFGRGCPATCAYCFKHASGLKMRTRSIDNIMTEIGILKSRGFKKIEFLDDCFGATPKEASGMIKKINKLNIDWTIKTVIPYMNKKGVPKLLADNGCTKITLEVESYNGKLLESLGRQQSVAKIDDTIDGIQKTDLNLNVRLMLGIPGETESTLKRTEKFVSQNDFHGVEGYLSVLYPNTAIGLQNRFYYILTSLERAGTVQTAWKNEINARKMWMNFDDLFNSPSLIETIRSKNPMIYKDWKKGQDMIEGKRNK